MHYPVYPSHFLQISVSFQLDRKILVSSATKKEPNETHLSHSKPLQQFHPYHCLSSELNFQTRAVQSNRKTHPICPTAYKVRLSVPTLVVSKPATLVSVPRPHARSPNRSEDQDEHHQPKRCTVRATDDDDDVYVGAIKHRFLRSERNQPHIDLLENPFAAAAADGEKTIQQTHRIQNFNRLCNDSLLVVGTTRREMECPRLFIVCHSESQRSSKLAS